jgi:hypothetical protein
VRLAHRATLRGVNPCLRRVKLLSCSQRDPRFRRQAREPDTTAPMHNCERTRPIGSWHTMTAKPCTNSDMTRGSRKPGAVPRTPFTHLLAMPRSGIAKMTPLLPLNAFDLAPAHRTPAKPPAPATQAVPRTAGTRPSGCLLYRGASELLANWGRQWLTARQNGVGKPVGLAHRHHRLPRSWNPRPPRPCHRRRTGGRVVPRRA